MRSGFCNLCRARVGLALVSPELAGVLKTPTILLTPRPVEAVPAGEPEGGELAVLEADAKTWVRARVEVGGPLKVFRLHATVCPVERERAAARARGETLPPRDSGACRSCAAPVYWVATVASKGEKRVPLDPEPHRGIVLTTAEAREFKGSKAAVRGYTAEGENLVVRKGGQMGLLEGDRRVATVYVTHWATCPQRAEWRQQYDRDRAR